ncbi:MAG: DUF1992 domain-containing protein [Clostridiales bacterium]|nr:DUF1992 domain-containing protein [Eubacteriales bacterium]MDH7566521.1 DUF1992 domain-containing protein [Clostridiales bacterium]
MPLSRSHYEDKYFFNEYDEPFDIAALIAEEKIQQAIKNGDFDNLSCKGKPLELEDRTFVPKERRMANKVLKNAGFLPVEMELKKEIYALEKQIEGCKNEGTRKSLLRELSEKTARCGMLMERIPKK